MSKEIAAVKKYDCPYCGEFDMFLTPTIAAGNMMHKAMVLCGGSKMAGVVIGAKVPVVLTLEKRIYRRKNLFLWRWLLDFVNLIEH